MSSSDHKRRAHGALLQKKRPGHAALRHGRYSVAGGIYLVTATTADRTPFFNDFWPACAAASCFEDREIVRDTTMLAWVLMPDHAHWLLQIGEQDRLDRCIDRLKSASARRANIELNRRGRLWSRAYHDHGLRKEDDLQDIARYVVANPIRAGLANRVGDYPFWNAIWL